MLTGHFFLNTDGDVFYKSIISSEALKPYYDNPYIRAIWAFDPADPRKSANILVEALAAGADRNRVFELAKRWGRTDETMRQYAEGLDLIVEMDENAWCVKRKDFECLATDPAGFGHTVLEALAELAVQLGYEARKENIIPFEELCKEPLTTGQK